MTSASGLVDGVHGPVLDAVPEELRSAARMLRGIGAEASGLTQRVGAQGVAGAGWTGLAALEQQARTESLHALLGLTARPGEEAAHLLERAALEIEDTAGRVRQLGLRLDEAVLLRGRLRAAGPPADPLELESWRLRLEEVEDQIASTRALVQQAHEDFDAMQRRLASGLSETWDRASTAIGQAVTLGTLAMKAFGVKKQALFARAAVPGLLAVLQARRAGSQEAIRAARAIAEARRASVEQISMKPGFAGPVLEQAAKLPRVPAAEESLKFIRKGFAGWTVVDGLRSAADGGGYEGWRGGVTRVLGGAAAAGAPASFVPVPPVALAGTVSVAAYSVWMAGNWAYDNRREIAQAARAAGRLVRSGGDAVLRKATSVGSGVRDSLVGAKKGVQRWATRQAVRVGVGTVGLVRRARERLGGVKLPDPRELVTLGGRGHEFGPIDMKKIERVRRMVLFPELPSLPRLPVELPRPGLGGFLPRGVTP